MNEIARLRNHEKAEVPDTDNRLELDSGNYALLKDGIVHLYLSNDQELFSVDANSLSFEKKLLGAAMQIYLLGFNRGKAQEAERLKERVQGALNLVF